MGRRLRRRHAGRGATGARFARCRSPDIPDGPEIIRIFRAFTLAWSLVFVIRAVALLWIMDRYPLAQAVATPTAFGWVSMGPCS